MTQPFLETGEHRFIIACLDIDDPIRGQARLRDGWSKQILPDDAPQYLAFGSCGNPGRKQRSGGAVDRAIATASHLMQRTQAQAAARQAGVYLRQPKRQNRQCAAIAGFDPPDFFAQRRKGGQWPHDEGSLSNGGVMFLLCSRLPPKSQAENFFLNWTELFQKRRFLRLSINFTVKPLANKTRTMEDGRPIRRRFCSVRSRLSDPTE
jgi:hypothetical protein